MYFSPDRTELQPAPGITSRSHTALSPTRLPRAARGFTLLELLVVLAILVLIAGFAGPKVLKWLSSAKSDAATVEIKNLSTQIDLYRLEVGTYPPDLQALVEKPSGATRWNGPYLKGKSIPKDPWEREYSYRLPGENGDYDLYSLGGDNAEGGEGEDRDLTSWE